MKSRVASRFALSFVVSLVAAAPALAQERQDHLPQPSLSFSESGEFLAIRQARRPAQTEVRCTVIEQGRHDTTDTWQEKSRKAGVGPYCDDPFIGVYLRSQIEDRRVVVLRPASNYVARTPITHPSQAQFVCLREQAAAFHELMRNQENASLVREFLGVQRVRFSLEENSQRAIEDSAMEYGVDRREPGTLKMRVALNSRGECFVSSSEQIVARLRTELPSFQLASAPQAGQSQAPASQAASDRRLAAPNPTTTAGVTGPTGPTGGSAPRIAQ